MKPLDFRFLFFDTLYQLFVALVLLWPALLLAFVLGALVSL